MVLQGNHQLQFSSAVFSLDTIKRAAYRLSDRCAFEFQIAGDEITCSLFFGDGVTSEEASLIANDFRNDVLDQDLRQSIREETAAVRNAILAYAFSRTGLQGEQQV